MRDRPRKEAPDYTDATLVMGFFNLVWIFIALWAVLGYWSVIAAGFALNYAIDRLELYKASQ